MKKNELRILFKFLQELSDHMSNAGCLTLENNDENRQLYYNAYNHAGIDEYPTEEHWKELVVNDGVILDYLVKRLKEEFKYD